MEDQQERRMEDNYHGEILMYTFQQLYMMMMMIMMTTVILPT